jgi:hypothetical protein
MTRKEQLSGALTITMAATALLVFMAGRPVDALSSQCDKNGLLYDNGSCVDFSDVNCCEENTYRRCEQGSWAPCGSC